MYTCRRWTGCLFWFHLLHNHNGKCPFAEILRQNILFLPRVHIRRQVGEHVIIDSGIYNPKNRRDQQQKAKNQNQHPVFGNGIAETQHNFIS